MSQNRTVIDCSFHNGDLDVAVNGSGGEILICLIRIIETVAKTREDKERMLRFMNILLLEGGKE